MYGSSVYFDSWYFKDITSGIIVHPAGKEKTMKLGINNHVRFRIFSISLSQDIYMLSIYWKYSKIKRRFNAKLN